VCNAFICKQYAKAIYKLLIDYVVFVNEKWFDIWNSCIHLKKSKLEITPGRKRAVGKLLLRNLYTQL
jgi:hypothetical protein